MSVRKIVVHLLFLQVCCSCKHRFFRASSCSTENTIKAGQHFYVEPAGQFQKNIPGVQQENYVLKEKLYFILCDNPYSSEDSRFIGLIPYSKMYGIVK